MIKDILLMLSVFLNVSSLYGMTFTFLQQKLNVLSGCFACIDPYYPVYKNAKDTILYIQHIHQPLPPPSFCQSLITKIGLAKPLAKKAAISYFSLLPQDLRLFFLKLWVVPTYEKHGSHSEFIVSCIQSNDLTSLRSLLKAGVSPHIKNNAGETPLFTAIHAHNVAAADLLLQAGAHSNEQDPQGATPLMHSIISMDISLIELLLNYQATPDIINRYGRTAHFYAHENELRLSANPESHALAQKIKHRMSAYYDQPKEKKE